MQGIKGASLSEKGLIRSITGGSGIGCMVQESIIELYASAGIHVEVMRKDMQIGIESVE